MRALISILVLLTALASKAQISIGTTNPDSNAILDVSSTNKGVLFPRLTSAERTSISNALEGLLVFDSDENRFYHRINLKWHVVNPWVSEYNSTSNLFGWLGKGGDIGVGINSAMERLHLDGFIMAEGIRFPNSKELKNQPGVKGGANSNYLSFGSSTDQDYIGYQADTLFINKSPGNLSPPELQIENHLKAGIFEGQGIIPIGGIIIWSGDIPPNGWALCDGDTTENGMRTPDLRGKFVSGYHSVITNLNNPGNLSEGGSTFGQNGGMDSIVLDSNQLPSHLHVISSNTNTRGNHAHKSRGKQLKRDRHNNSTKVRQGVSPDSIRTWNPPSTWHYGGEPAGNHSHSFNGNTASSGSGMPYDNRPPYYVVSYIMRYK